MKSLVVCTSGYGGMRKIAWAVSLILLVLGCAAKQPLQDPVPYESSHILAGDELEIVFFYVPELNETQNVRPDGKLYLHLVGEVVAEGKTPSELADELRALYDPILTNPEVSVIIRSLPEVQVTGEVINPGPQAYWEGMTVLEAIMQAGGFKREDADLENVKLIRRGPEGRVVKKIDLTKFLKDKSDEKPVYVRRMDIIYVPPR